MAADALAGLLLLAGGIAIAIGLHGVTCDPKTQGDVKKLVDNDLINGGSTPHGGQKYPGRVGNALIVACQKAKASQAMQFVTFGFAMATIALVFLTWKKGRSGHVTGAYA